MEHEELLDLSTFEDFTKNLEKYMNQIIAPLRLKLWYPILRPC